MTKRIWQLLIVCISLYFYACTEQQDESTKAIIEETQEDIYQLIFYFDDDFADTTQTKFKRWISDVNEATQACLGTYPFDIHIHFIRSNRGTQPVSFGVANRKNGISSVTLYVNPASSYEDLMADWTAPHELSHLSIPFLGKSNKWFSEGYATFFSRQILMDMGYYTQDSFDSLYHHRIQLASTVLASDEESFVAKVPQLLENHNYSDFYWGSSSFFMTIDKRLREEQGKRFTSIIYDYQSCCRLKDKSLKDVIRSFDQIIGAPWCNDLMRVYRNNSVNEALENYR